MFKVSGIWVSPFEVESALGTHAAVLEAAVVPMPDADGLLKPKAFVVLKPGVSRRARPRRRPEGAREVVRRDVEVSALDRSRRDAPKDRHRQNPALQAPHTLLTWSRRRARSRLVATRWSGAMSATPVQSASCCSTKGSARSAPGVASPKRSPRHRISLCSSTPAPAMATHPRYRSPARSTTCSARPPTSLPSMIDAAGFSRVILLGHSDGASIAAYYAGTVEDHRVVGLVLLAPHFFVEDMTVGEIAAVRDRYERDLRPRLARHHADVDSAFWGWNTRLARFPNSAQRSTSRRRSRTSAFQCLSFRARTTPTAPWHSSPSPSAIACARSRLYCSRTVGTSRTATSRTPRSQRPWSSSPGS